jgi:predicted PurR-regulated permease PerM
MVYFSGTLVKETILFYQVVLQWVNEGQHEAFLNGLLNSSIGSLWHRIVEKTASLDIQIVPLVGKSAQVVSETIVGQIQAGAKNFLLFVLNYLVAIFIFFFFIRDGAALGQAIKDLFPMTPENKEKFFDRLLITVSAIVRGLVVTAAVQAVLSGIAFVILGVPFAIFFSALIAFLALVPIGGAAFVWFPIVIYLGLSGSWVKASVMLIWGGGVISMVDNILRPLLIGDRTQIPTLFLFLAILGGLSYYGVIGVFLGPIFLSLFIALIEIYRKEYPTN